MLVKVVISGIYQIFSVKCTSYGGHMYKHAYLVKVDITDHSVKRRSSIK